MRVWVYAALFVAGAVLFSLDVTHHRIARDARQAVVDIASPVLTVFSGAVMIGRSWVDETRELARVYDEVEQLRDENRELRGWRQRAHELEGRNRQFEALLRLQPDPIAEPVTARAIADTRSHYSRTMIVNAGHAAGVEEGNAVLGADGLVGRVISAGARSARVLLVNDLESRIPVYVGEARHRAIMTGTNGAEPTLQHLSVGAHVGDGDLVVTSGEGGLLPPGLPIGQVEFGADNAVSVSLASDPVSAEFVRVISYHVPIDVADGVPPLPEVIAGQTGVASASQLEASVAQGGEASDAPATGQ